jgi:hypothetical protein
MDKKSYLKRRFPIYILIVVVFSYLPAYACTAFMMSDSGRVLVGNNEDYNIPHTRVWFIPAENEQYGRVYFGYENWSPQGGMNDQGLFFDFFATKPLEVQKSKKKPEFKGSIIDTMAAKCATVEEVLNLFDRYNLEFMKKFQMFVVDRTGDAAIIEGDDIIRKTGSCQVVTNFHQSKVAKDRRPCEWHKPSCTQYKIANRMLAEHGLASVELFRDILNATHRNTVYSRTLYSNIYDLEKGLVYLYYRHDFDHEVVLDLNIELKKGCHYYEIPSLFGEESTYGSRTYSHSNPKFRISYPKHFKVIQPAEDEVFRAECPFSGTPLLLVFVEDKPRDILLKDIGEQKFTGEISKLGTDVRLASNLQTSLRDGTPANELRYDWVTKDNWPVKTLIVSTYRKEKLIFSAVTSLAHPEALREFLYSLEFK